MNYEIEQKARALSQAHTRRKRWQRIVAALAALTLLVTGYAMSLPALTQSSTTCGLEEHMHSVEDGCYTQTQSLNCPFAEGEGHIHTDDCYAEESVQVCDLEEDEDHAHDADCYETQRVLVCELEESEPHVHTDDCYTSVWELTCEKKEHTHTDDCYVDLDADVETAEVWERTVADVKLTGVWADDLISVAQSQLGYKESTKNYAVDGGENKGYTRYGAWYGSPYADWCAMFVAFCLNYAGVDSEAVPVSADCDEWINLLTEKDLFAAAGEGVAPKAGDLIFFDFNHNGTADHMGIICDLTTDGDGNITAIRTIEGNASDKVQEVNYGSDDSAIFGYGILPENPVTVKNTAKAARRAPAADASHPLSGKTFAIMSYSANPSSSSDYNYVAMTSTSSNGKLVGVDRHLRPQGQGQGKIERVFDKNTIENLGYCPDPSVCIWTFESVSGKENTYYVKYKNGGYLTFDTNSSTAGISGTPAEILVIQSSLFNNCYILRHKMSSGQWSTLTRSNSIDSIFGSSDDSKLFRGFGTFNDSYSTNSTSGWYQAMHFVEYYSPDNIHTVTAADAPGVKVEVFNYDVNINNVSDWAKNLGYTFRNSTEPTVDGKFAIDYGSQGYSPKMEQKADSDGYPLTKYGSLKYLFDYSQNYYVSKGSMVNGGGLFQKDGDTYYYSSNRNSAYYNPTTNQFELYDMKVQLNDNQIYDFFPFNKVKNSDSLIIAEKDGQIVGQEVLPDLWFGMSVSFDFYVTADGKLNGNDMVFNFKGDDDVYVYIDDYLVLNIGGGHPALPGSINFATGAVEYERRKQYDSSETNEYTSVSTSLSEIFPSSVLSGGIFKPYSKHKFRFFILERGGADSCCDLSFNLPLFITETTVTKDVDIPQALNTEYDFTIKQNGSVVKNLDYTIVNKENGAFVRSGNTGSTGTFKMHANERAVLPLPKDSRYTYSIAETQASDTKSIVYIMDGRTVTSNSVSFSLGDEPKNIVFRNNLKTYDLKVSNKILGAINQMFEYTVTIKDSSGNLIWPLESWVPSTGGGIDGNNHTIGFGLFQDGEVTLAGLPYGARVTVVQTAKTGFDTTRKIDSGTETKSYTATVTMNSNHRVDFINSKERVNLTVSKTVSGYSSDVDNFSFTLSAKDGTNVLTPDASWYTGVSGVTVSGDTLTFTLTGDTNKVFKVPKGAVVTIAETANDNFTTTTKIGTAAAVSGTSATTSALSANTSVAFTNTRKTVTLKTTNTVTGDGATGSERMSYAITLKNAKGTAVTPQASWGSASFNLTNGGESSITIPRGFKFVVTQTAYTGAMTTHKINSGSTVSALATAETTANNNATVAFLNTIVAPDPGTVSLTVQKTVVGYSADTSSFSFALTVTKDGSAVTPQTSWLSGSTVSGNTLNFTMAGGESKVISNIPEGAKVTVTESANAKFTTAYALTGAATASGSSRTASNLDLSGDCTLTFTNTRKTQSLTVTKTVANETGSTASFPFTVALTNSANNAVTPASSWITGITGATIDGNLIKFSLGHNGSATITNIPYGVKAVVTETDAGEYIPTYKIGTGAATSGTAATIASLTANQTVAFTNTKNVVSNVTITKRVSNYELSRNTYQFTVYDASTNQPVRSVPYVIVDSDGVSRSGTSHETFGSFILYRDETATLTLPGGKSYYVKEGQHDATSTSVCTLNGVTCPTAYTSSTFTTGTTANTLVFTNTLKECKLTVSNTVIGGTDSFDYTLQIKTGSGSTASIIVPNNDWLPAGASKAADGKVTFSLSDGQSVEFTKLPMHSNVSVTETGKNGYTTTYTLDSGASTEGVASQFFMNKNRVLAFTNEKTAEPTATLIVKTTTVGGGSTEFPYSVKITGTDNKPVIPPANTGYTVNTATGEITFRQRNGQSKTIPDIPIGAKVTITETSHDGYNVTVKEGNVTLASADTVQITVNEDRTLEFVNNPGILLPNTGGGGSLFYTFGGTALAAFALMYGYSRRRKREGRSTL